MPSDALSKIDTFLGEQPGEPRSDRGPRNLPKPSAKKKARVRAAAIRKASRPKKLTQRKRARRVRHSRPGGR
jgi:hypothetical protein